MSELSGTKEVIFDKFIEMTSKIGYENVSMRDIAREIGLKAASIYNHFDGKRTILEFAYNYYLERQYDNRIPVEEMNKLVETASAADMIRFFMYTFESEDQKKYFRMILITKIIYMRQFQDKTANNIFLAMYSDNANYVTEILQHGINVGRIDPEFDIRTFAEVLVGAMAMMGIISFSDESYEVRQLKQEEYILALHARLLATAILHN